MLPGDCSKAFACHENTGGHNAPMPLRNWFFVLLLLTSCQSGPPIYKESRFMMGTIITFTVIDADKAQAAAAVRDAADTMQRLADALTIYGTHANSVKAFNASTPGTPIRLGPDAEQVMVTSMQVFRQSHGAFDPALGALDMLWGFSIQPPPTTPPFPEAIKKAMANAHCLSHTAGGWVRDSAVCKLDFGGIAKGYAVDQGIRILQEHGIHNAIINAGGNLHVIGSHGDRPWHIGIKHPRRPGGILGAIDLNGGESISTSGDYEHFFMYKGKRYHHILNPATGRPARGVQSATIVAPSGILSDAWSTALFVLGPAGLPLIAKLGMQGLVVDAAGHLHMTPGMRKRFQPVSQ
jgi:FAD:protein FMN transferase